VYFVKTIRKFGMHSLGKIPSLLALRTAVHIIVTGLLQIVFLSGGRDFGAGEAL